MTPTFDSLGIPALRARIVQLREEIKVATLAYRQARDERRLEEAASLLRQKSELIRQLFQAQGDLLLAFQGSQPVQPDRSADIQPPASLVIW